MDELEWQIRDSDPFITVLHFFDNTFWNEPQSIFLLDYPHGFFFDDLKCFLAKSDLTKVHWYTVSGLFPGHGVEHINHGHFHTKNGRKTQHFSYIFLTINYLLDFFSYWLDCQPNFFVFLKDNRFYLHEETESNDVSSIAI